MAYGARLESGLGETPRGFKSRILRQSAVTELSRAFVANMGLCEHGQHAAVNGGVSPGSVAVFDALVRTSTPRSGGSARPAPRVSASGSKTWVTTLAELGRRVVGPTDEDDDADAMRGAVLRSRVAMNFWKAGERDAA